LRLLSIGILTMYRSEKGFTVIELGVVVAIIGMLAAVAIPAYTDYMKHSKVAEAFMLTVSVKKAINDYYAYHGRFPANNLAAGVAPAEQLIGNYVSRVDVVNGDILVTFGPQNGEGMAGRTLNFRPEVKENALTGTVIWHYCGGDEKTTLARKYLPYRCKR